MRRDGNPIARGSAMAVGAAILFGVTTPFVRVLGAHSGAFPAAMLLYAGAALASWRPQPRGGEAPLGRRELVRVVLIAIIGAALAPASLVWGLQRAGALSASLLLNLEAVFTVALARALYREPVGRRVAVAVALMVAAGALLGLRAHSGGASSALGLAAVVAATLGWALDNTLTRPLADFEPRAVVFGKSLLGAGLSLAIAFALGEAWPSAESALGLLACGAVGYGLSLRLYLRAQRSLGAARTGSLFALAPFAGATLAFAWGDREHAPLVASAAVLFAVAVYLHASEEHRHGHRHLALEHEHAHSHDDGHHSHAHDSPVSGEHSHPHRHEATEHDHPHGADLHHRHPHD